MTTTAMMRSKRRLRSSQPWAQRSTRLNTLLGDLGVSRYDQIATWTAADIAEVDPYLGTFKGRITRDNWIEQAAFLAKGDIAGFEAKFGKL